MCGAKTLFLFQDIVLKQAHGKFYFQTAKSSLTLQHQPITGLLWSGVTRIVNRDGAIIRGIWGGLQPPLTAPPPKEEFFRFNLNIFNGNFTLI